MTDEQQDSINQEDEIDSQPEEAVSADALATDEFNVESALAAVSSLHDLSQEDEASAKEDEESEDEPEDDEIESEDEDSEVVAVAEEDYAEYTEIETESSNFPHPPMSVLHRGQLASIVPSVLLIISGAVLTFMLTTAEQVTFNMPLMGALTLSGVGIALVAYWFSSARWTSGSFFMGMMFALSGATLAYLILPNNLDVSQGYPLILTAIGTAFVLTDLMNPSQNRLWLIGLIFAIGGFAALLITANVLDESLVAFIQQFWYIAPVIVIGLLILPLLRRSRT